MSMVIAATGALVFPAAGFPADPPSPPPPDTPSISQYVEQVPTSGGWSSPGVGKAKTSALSPKVATSLHSQNDSLSQQLEKAATSSVYGAPQQKLRKPAGGEAAPKASNALSAAVSAVNDSGHSHVAWLLLALVLVTTAVAWSAVRLRAR